MQNEHNISSYTFASDIFAALFVGVCKDIDKDRDTSYRYQYDYKQTKKGHIVDVIDRGV